MVSFDVRLTVLFQETNRTKAEHLTQLALESSRLLYERTDRSTLNYLAEPVFYLEEAAQARIEDETRIKAEHAARAKAEEAARVRAEQACGRAEQEARIKAEKEPRLPESATPATIFHTTGFEAIAAETIDYSKKSLANASALVEKLLGAKSFERVIYIRSEYARTSYADFVAYLKKIGELNSKLANEAFKRRAHVA